jgi:hypothetical protein
MQDSHSEAPQPACKAGQVFQGASSSRGQVGAAVPQHMPLLPVLTASSNGTTATTRQQLILIAAAGLAEVRYCSHLASASVGGHCAGPVSTTERMTRT